MKKLIFKNFVAVTSLLTIVILINFEIFPINTYKIFYLLSSLGEDTAQLLNSVSIFHQADAGLGSLKLSLYSPFIDFFSFILSSISQIFISTPEKSILIVTGIVCIFPIIILNLLIVLRFGYEANPLILLIFILIFNIFLSPSIFAGHFNLLYSLAFCALGSSYRENPLLRSTLYSLATFSWYPSVIIFAYFIIEPVLSDFLKLSKKAALKLVNYIIILIFLLTIALIYIFINVSAQSSDWKFDLLREEGGGQNVSTMNIFIIGLILITVVHLNQKFLIGLNLHSVYATMLLFIIFLLYNVFIVATSSTYGINKLLTLIFLLFLIQTYDYLFVINKKINLTSFLSVGLPVILLITIMQGKEINSFIALYSKSNSPSYAGINPKQFRDILKLYDTEFDYYFIREDYIPNQNIESYLTSRWITSLLGKDDRKLDNQLGWRFLLLRRTDGSDFFSTNSITNSKFFVLERDSLRLSDKTEVKSLTK
jgi:hypothetical protein